MALNANAEKYGTYPNCTLDSASDSPMAKIAANVP